MSAITLKTSCFIDKGNDADPCECSDKKLCLVRDVGLLLAERPLLSCLKDGLTNVGQHRSVITVGHRAPIGAKNERLFGHRF